MMQKIIVFTLLLAACSALPPRHIQIFGNIFKKGLEEFSKLGSGSAGTIANPLKETKFSFTFPEVKLLHTFTIPLLNSV